MSATRRMLDAAPGAVRAGATRLAMASLLLVVLGVRPAAAQTEVIEYYGHDALGSIRIVFNSSGVATARADFEPFGGLFGAGSPYVGRSMMTPFGQVWVNLYNGGIRNAGISRWGSFR